MTEKTKVKKEETLWHNLSQQKLFETVHSSKDGLTQKEAKKRLERFGPNKLPEKKPLSRLTILLDQFKSPLVYILIIAAAISLALKEFIDFGVISAAIIINTVVGFFQENKANEAISKLKKLVELKAKVLRDGNEIEIDAQNLVTGDIIFLDIGDKVPADARLIASQDLQAMEASLTGESQPSDKKIGISDKGTALADRENMVYMGTVIVRGKGQAVVCETGPKTQLGQIVTLIKETPEEKTPLQQKLARFSRVLSLIILVITVVILFVGLLKGQPLFADKTHPQGGMLATAVAIAVAAIPEGLLVVVTVILAIGMRRILKKRALVRKLIATETLGSTSVICTDKTGTLTEGKMRVFQIITADKNFKKDLSRLDIQSRKDYKLILQTAILCNNAVIENPEKKLEEWKIIGDPTESALLIAATQAGLEKTKLEKEFPRITEVPFNAERKFMATLHQVSKGKQVILIKGAPEKILEKSAYLEIKAKRETLTKNKLKDLKAQYESLTNEGLRLLAFAYKETEKKVENLEAELIDLSFLGFIALKDPIRPEAKETFQLCKQAGIRPVIVTGDHKLTAKAIVSELGIKVTEDNILEGEELDKITDSQLKKKVKDIIIFARVEPSHKLRIIDAWQAKGEAVAMTGDGINDAPALKKADIGIALGSGTDVAKETSDIILLDNNFKTIVSAVEQGRVIFENIKKVILYLLSDSFSEMILISASLLLGWPLPILPAQILWINLITDGFPDITLTLEPGEKEVMQDKPRKKNEPILDKEMKVLIFIIGVVTDLVLLLAFYFLLKSFIDIEYIRTIIFAALGIDSLFYVFACRSFRHSILTKNPFSNKYLILGVLAGFTLQLLAIYEPHLQVIFRTQSLTWEWSLIIALGLVKLIAIEITKYIFIIKKRKVTG